MKIAVVGQGYVGGAYSTWFESHGHKVIRYGLEEIYAVNRDRVSTAELVVVAVPTPTGENGQDLSAVREAVALAGPDATVVIKSTVLPGTTDGLAGGRGGLTVFSPEFLRADHALEDIQRPDRTVLGVTQKRQEEARKLLRVFPRATRTFITTASTAEYIKYAANIMLLSKLVTATALHDARPGGSEWATIARALGADPRIGEGHMHINKQRGAGGHCLPKDIAALVGSLDAPGWLADLEVENLRLLTDSLNAKAA